ncbi:MAG: hypothetical protein HZA31_02300 [Opitutae bacterium]|nr:hypothetical protein [Opitutae bacterium]
MNWNDYEAVWKRQELPVGSAADLANLRATFETKRRKLHATLQVRDLTETGAALIVLVSFALFWRHVGVAGWPMAFAMLLILGVAGFFVRERIRARRHQVSAEAPLLAKVEADLAELRHQRRLLRTVWAWYLAPCAGAMAIHVGVMLHHAKNWEAIREPVFLLRLSAFFALVFWLAWAIKRRALRRQVEPRIAELEKLHRDLLAPK